MSDCNRFVFNEWVRDPKGPLLEKPPPAGKRPPNGIIWGHTINDFFWIRRIPGVDVMTIWTRSMIQEFGENFLGEEHEPEPHPRRFRPWPVLKLLDGAHCDPPLGLVDETCIFGHMCPPQPIESDDEVDDPPIIDDDVKDLDQPTVNETNVKIDIAEEKPVAPEPKIKTPLEPKLEEFIPEDFFPDILIVNDPHKFTRVGYGHHHCSVDADAESTQTFPRRYKRVWPKLAGDDDPTSAFNTFNTDPSCPSISFDTDPPSTPTDSELNIAHLNLANAPCLGVGHHSIVHQASLQLPHPLTARSPTQRVTVAAKMAFQNSEARTLLHNEAKMYDAFPKHLMEGWCGLNLVTPIKSPVPVGPVVPKFYGYYVPILDEKEHERREEALEKKRKREKEEAEAKAKKRDREMKETARKAEEKRRLDKERANANGEDVEMGSAEVERESVEDEDEGEDDNGDDDDHRTHAEDFDESVQDDDESEEEDESYETALKDLSPILLLEECGSPINPGDFSGDERLEFYSLVLRLHYANFLQGSFYVRNLLTQPGPLTVPPALRSHKTPSFRIIDFGRAEYWKYFLQEEQDAAAKREEMAQSGEKGKGKETELGEEQRKKEEEIKKKQMDGYSAKWWENQDYEVQKAQKELEIKYYNY